MKQFEDRIVAWQDGVLEGAELTAFEKELAERLGSPVPSGDETEWARVRALLVADSKRGEASLHHTDFFLSQFHQTLESEDLMVASGQETMDKPSRMFFGLPLFGWAGAALLLVATVVSALVIPRGSDADGSLPKTAELTQPAEVLHAQVFQSRVSATTFTTKTAGTEFTVLWLDGMEYVPADWQIN